MSYLNTYRNRLQATGNSFTDGIVSSSKQSVNNNFDNSLFSETISIDNVEYRAIISQEKKSDDKKLLLKPDTNINIGAVVKINELNYLAMDFLGEGINEIYPTATVKLCNSTFPIESDKTSVLMEDELGNPILDRFGDEVYEETDGGIVNVPCIVESTYSSKENNVQLPLPDGTLVISMQYSPTYNLDYDYKFEMYGEMYEIVHFDHTKVINDKGILTIRSKKVADK